MNEELLYFDIYGCKVKDIAVVKDELEKALSIEMNERDSTYFDLYYSYRKDGAEDISCMRNWNFDDNEILLKEYPEYPIIVHIEGTLHPEEFERKLGGSSIHFELLDRELA